MRDAMIEETVQSRLAELEADNARLRRLLDKSDAPGELRHRLRNTLAMLRAVIRQSGRTKDDVTAYVAHLEDRMEALMRAQRAIDDLGEVELHRIIAEELHHYDASEGEQVTLSGPNVLLQPRATQVMSLAVHELAVNAVEHGALVGKDGKVDVTWHVTRNGNTAHLRLAWKERGTKRLQAPAQRGFGTEVLQNMLAHELKAKTTLSFEPDGLRCTVEFPLTERIGHAAEQP